MVKFALVFTIFFTTLFGDELSLKIQNLIDSRTYKQNTAFIDIVFSPRSKYYKNG
ncbi:MAG: hypothetical protein GXO30_08870, partial [Epsilonproteobacteria bacterium]|nr:hypothetical protein [Campylobacterota bacterium]